MKKKLREIPKRTLTIFLAAAVIFTTVIGSANLSGVLARANEITQADGDYDTYNTTVYEALDAEEMAAYLLDEYPTLTLELDGEDTELKVKAWESEDYDPESAGTYTFTPVFKKSAVSAAENVDLPAITVVLEKNTIREVTADLSAITVTASEDLSISGLDLPEEIEIVLDLRTQAQYDEDTDEDGENTADDDDLIETTLAVEGWTCASFDGSTAGEYVFTPDYGDAFNDQYEWDTSLDEVSLIVCVEDTETSGTIDISGNAEEDGAEAQNPDDGESDADGTAADTDDAENTAGSSDGDDADGTAAASDDKDTEDDAATATGDEDGAVSGDDAADADQTVTSDDEDAAGTTNADTADGTAASSDDGNTSDKTSGESADAADGSEETGSDPSSDGADTDTAASSETSEGAAESEETGDATASESAAAAAISGDDVTSEAAAASDTGGDVTIGSFNAQLVSGAAENDSGDLVWTATTNTAGHKFKFRVYLVISGTEESQSLSAATIDDDGTVTSCLEIRIPYSILKDKDGDAADTFSCAYPSVDELEDMSEDELESADGFAYYIDEETNEVVIFNFKEIDLTYSGYFEVSYATSEKTQYYHDYGYNDGNDKTENDDLIGTFSASISVKSSESGETTTSESGKIDVYIDSTTTISSVSKGYPTAYTSWQNTWGTEPSDLDASYYLVYTITTKIAAGTQYYDFTLDDSTITYTVTYSDGTTKSGSLSNTDSAVSIVAYKLQGSTYQTVDSDKLDETTSTGISVTIEDVAPSTSTQYRYDYIVVALSGEVFSDSMTSYTITNTASGTVSPADDVDDDTTAKSTKTFSWTKPVWTTPSGSFNIFKYGTENRYETNKTTYVNGSKHNWDEYISYELNTLQEEDATEESSISDIKYRVEMIGYAYPWTLMEDWETTEGYSTTDSDGNTIANYNAYGHSEVTYVITDDTLYPLNSDGTSLDGTDMSNYTGEENLNTYGQVTAYADNDVDPLDSEDYDFSYLTWSITMKDAKRDDNGDPTVTSSYSYDLQTLSSSTYSEDDILTLYVKVDGSWLEAGSWSLKNSTWKAASAGGNYVSSFTSSQVTFATGVDGYRFVFSNAYYYSYMSIYAYVTLYATENVQNWVGEESDDTEQDVVLLRNAVTQQVYYADEYEAEETSDDAQTSTDSGTGDGSTSSAAETAAASVDDGGDDDDDDDGLIIQITKVIGDRIRRVERDSSLSKSVSMTSYSTTSKTYTLTWKIAMQETVTSGTGDVAYKTQESGTFYDLLPYGSTYKSGSVLIQTESGYLDESDYGVKVIDNYAGSGRTLLIVRILVSASYYTLWFDNVYAWEVLDDVEETLLNPVAYQTGNSDIADGYADDASTVFTDEDGNAEYMSGLDYSNDGETFIYSSASTTVNIETSAATGLKKKVKTTEENDYSYDTTVYSDGTYSYRLRYSNTYTAESKDMIFYDSLENYSDEDTGSSDWYGTLTGIDTAQLSQMGIDPVVYISTQLLDLTVEANRDLTDSSIWTEVTSSTDLSTAKSVAIDMRYSDAENKTEFVLEEGESVAVVLYMKAPSTDTSDVEGDYPETYNNVYMSLTYGSDVSSQDTSSSELIHHDYTTVRYAVAGDVYLEKVSSEDDTQTISGITFVLSGTSDYGTEVYETVTTNVNGIASWTDIEKGTYTIQETGEYDDWVSDHNQYTVEIGEDGSVTVTDQDGTTYTITEDDPYVFEDDPRVHADITFTKIDYITGYALGTGFTFYLSGTSDYGTSVNEYASSTSSGTVTFSNIEMGTYTLVETQSDDDHIYEEITYTVKVDENGQVTISGSEVTTSKSGSYLITNQPYQELTILKRSSYDNSAISGVEFTLSGTSDLGTSYSQVQETNSNGSLTFTNLEPGTYTLKETSIENVPEGTTVAEDDTVRIVVVSSDGTITIDGEELNSYHNYTIVNTVVASDTISVIKKWVTENVSALYDDDGDPIFPTIYLSTEEPATYVDVTLDLGDSDEVGTGSITINGTSYSDGATISVKYGSTLSSLLGSATPTYTSGTFLTWYADSRLTETYDTSSAITEDVTVYASVRKNALYYAVSVYGIMADTYSSDSGTTTETAGLTFGPASGYSYVSQYASHTPSGTTSQGARDTASTTIDGESVSTTQGEENAHRCIHEDSWEMIIWWSEHNPYVYEQCMTGGKNSSGGTTGVSCTKSIEIELNTTLASTTASSYTNMTGDGAGALYYAINSNYRMWNGYNSSGSYYSYGGWGASQIRQVLNGADTAGYSTYQSCWHNSSGTEFTKITETTSLLSCFPSELQNAIVSTQITYNSHTGTSSSEQTSETCYDKLFLMSTTDVWNYRISYEPDTTQYTRNSSLVITASSYSKAKLFCESGSGVSSWLRSVIYNSGFSAYLVGSTGSYSTITGVSYAYGLSPCFCLK